MPSHPLRWRALAKGIILALFFCAMAPYNAAWLINSPLGGGHFPLMPFFWAIILYIGTASIAYFSGKPPLLNGMEILVIWLFMVVGTSIGYAGLAETFLLNITAPAWAKNGGSSWVVTLSPYLPEKWFLNNTKALSALYNGIPGGKYMSIFEIVTHIHWKTWMPILTLWGTFILLCYITMLCIVTLFTRQWVENEKVNFPLLRVPQLMGEALDEGRMRKFFSNHYLLWGLLLPILLHTVNGLHEHLPGIPQLPTLILAGKFFPKFGLFSGFHKIKLYIIPAFIGFAFLTTRQISFSFWIFYLLGALFMGLLYVIGLQVPQAALGITFGPNLARPAEAQVIGAWIVFFCFLLWLARAHLKKSILESFQIFTGKVPPPTSGELIPAGISSWGTLLGSSLLAIWCYTFGMPLHASITVPLVFLIFMVVTSRVITQGGLPQFMLTAAPSDAVTGLAGSTFLGSTGVLITVVMQKMLFLDVRESLMPTLVHGAKITEQAESLQTRKRFAISLGIVLLFSVLIALTSMLILAYKRGLRDLSLDWATSSTTSVFENAARLIETPTGPNTIIMTFAGVGALCMLLLVFCYYTFHWWPLHPIGFLAAYSKSMRVLWFCFFLGWLCNQLVLHYGGTALYRRLRFFFVGLVIGDILMGGFWHITAFFTGTVYHVFPL